MSETAINVLSDNGVSFWLNVTFKTSDLINVLTQIVMMSLEQAYASELFTLVEIITF